MKFHRDVDRYYAIFVGPELPLPSLDLSRQLAQRPTVKKRNFKLVLNTVIIKN